LVLDESEEGSCVGYKNIDTSLTFGGGVDFAFAGKTLIIDGRYALGLSSIQPDGEGVKNRVFTLSIGLGFGL
jgi:hypothetical protein